MKDSTRAFFRLHGWKHVPDFLHGYFYVRHTEGYVKTLLAAMRAFVRILPAPGRDTVRPLLAYMPDRYHGKVMRLEDARKFFALRQDVEIAPSRSKKVIPFEIANRIVIQEADSIVVLDCSCRKGAKNPCVPTDVCMVVGEPYASFILEQGRTLNPRRVTQGEALSILEACHEQGCVHNAFFKDVMGGRFYALCNCCKCCCGGLEVERVLERLNLEEPIRVLAPSGYLAEVDAAGCKGCGLCVSRCPFEAISLVGDIALVHSDLCKGCGTCTETCPEEAIRLLRDVEKGIPLDLEDLTAESATAVG